MYKKDRMVYVEYIIKTKPLTGVRAGKVHLTKCTDHLSESELWRLNRSVSIQTIDGVSTEISVKVDVVDDAR